MVSIQLHQFINQLNYFNWAGPLNILNSIISISCIGTTAVGHLSSQDNLKNRFCYRVRVENFNQPSDGDDNNVVQLLGRTWKVSRCETVGA